jgi:zinc protease
MIEFSRFTLANGLRVVVHEDHSTPMAALNVIYDVGARDEAPERTGFAHLFEHLMFGGSANIPDFDTPIQNAGGENNAFTNNDVTNFYEILPAENIEIAFWLESDRMLKLRFNKKALNTQRKVVVEEFKETCLDEPYGDVWHHLSAMAYKEHPYRWPTIGLVPQHIEEAQLEEVKAFFYKFYRPNNAILVATGNVTESQVRELSEKWFGPIPAGDIPVRALPPEPPQTALRRKTVETTAPLDALYMAFRMCDRNHPDFYVVDLLSDVLSNGASSRLFQRLLKEQRIVSNIDAYLTGSIDEGLFILEAKPNPDTNLEQIEAAIWKELDDLKQNLVPEMELQKLKNQMESSLAFSEGGILNKATNLAFCELLGDANLINQETEFYEAVTVQDIQRLAQSIFQEKSCSILYYKAIK